ncbi:MAG TPA: FtsX-like permease family protein, partial [Ktedonobacterales bacterium]|nr:FtsX-like permease family protein [Ktedonobacterales bacterium]
MRALLTKIRGDLRRRKLQACIVALIVAMATGVGTLALELLNESSAPYTRAFDQYQGAHLTVFYNATRITPDQLDATTHLAQVTASAGPWQTINVPLEIGAHKQIVGLIARSDPGGPVDRLLIATGRWATNSGEIVLTRSFAQSLNVRVGDHVRALSGADRPDLVVVGEVADIDEGPAGNFSPQGAWVQPAQFAALVSPGQHPDEMMVYRFHDAATDAALQARSKEIEAAVPPNSVDGSYTHLLIQQVYALAATLTLTFLLAFSVFALGAASLIVANLVSGAVLTSRRAIGIVRALGFTPGQVVTTFVAQMLAPALIGCLIGVPLGVLGSRPLVNSSADALGLPAPSGLDPVAPLLATVGGLLIVALAAAIPALRAGLLRPVDAISPVAAIGRHKRSRLGGLGKRLRLPLPVTLGARDSFARPVRGTLTTVAVIIGVSSLVFAVGVTTTFQQIANNRALVGTADVTVTRYGSFPDSQLMATLNEQPGTKDVEAYGFFNMTLPQLSSPVSGEAMRGAPGPHGLPIIAGRWFEGPGEVVGGPAFFKESHLKIGDTFTGAFKSKQVTLRLVGEFFDFQN